MNKCQYANDQINANYNHIETFDWLLAKKGRGGNDGRYWQECGGK